MSTRPHSPSTSRPRTTLAVALAVLAAAVVAVVLGVQAFTASSSSAGLHGVVLPGGDDGPPVSGGLTAADGVVAGRVTVLDDHVPAVGNLDPALLGALRRAAADAARDGVDVAVTSGWRSAAHQEQLLREAVAEYGSEEEAARWVATADTSAHVSGDGVDVGPTDAMSWLSQHGEAYGLCQIYANEPWHYELRPEAVDGGCPRMYDDPTDDPRMQP
jgi:zinc D-Ala-D-Ala carboxypeptidase